MACHGIISQVFLFDFRNIEPFRSTANRIDDMGMSRQVVFLVIMIFRLNYEFIAFPLILKDVSMIMLHCISFLYTSFAAY